MQQSTSVPLFFLLAAAGGSYAFSPSAMIMGNPSLGSAAHAYPTGLGPLSRKGFAARGHIGSPLQLLRFPSRTSSLALKASTASYGDAASKTKNSSWLAWWAQTILSVISGVTIFFANAVKGPAQTNILSNGILLASVGLALSFINVFWTWGYGRMAGKLPTADDPAAKVKSLRRSIKLGVIFALSGMLITLMGAEQIVGTMVAKAITGSIFYNGQAATSAAAAGMQLQALDIFVVQANTNTLLAHLASLVNSLYLTQVLPSSD